MKSYLDDAAQDLDTLLEDPIICNKEGDIQAVDFIINWSLTPSKNKLEETYVNLIPTQQGGSHLNGFKSGFLEAIKEFCDYRNLIPKGIKLNSDDVIKDAIFVISSKMQNPQFAGQTKERLDSKIMHLLFLQQPRIL